MLTKGKLWIVYTNDTPRAGAYHKTPDFEYLACHLPMNKHQSPAYYWTSFLECAHKFTKKRAIEEATKRCAKFDYHPEYRYE